MQHISGISRQQMRISSIEEAISPENQVLFINAFVAYINFSKRDFAVKTLKTKSPLDILSQNFTISA